MGRRLTTALAVAVVIAVAVALAGCGSSKPSYCSKLTTLKQSVKDLPSTDVIGNGVNALKANINKVADNANAVVSAAKSDFPNESKAISSSVDSLKTSVSQLQNGASASVLAQTAGNVSALATSVKNFSSASSSKCG
jgi:predicted PurR-regulated permease PerM